MDSIFNHFLTLPLIINISFCILNTCNQLIEETWFFNEIEDIRDEKKGSFDGNVNIGLHF